MMDKKRVYLGDGVYLEYNFGLRLFTSDGYDESNEIHLDVHTAEALYEALKEWLEVE